MATTVSRLQVIVEANTRNLERGLSKADRDVAGFSRRGTQHVSGFSRALGVGLRSAAVGAAVGVGGLALALRNGYQELAESQRVGAQTNAVLKSTGGIAGVSAKDVTSLANALSRKSGIDDEVVQSGENMLLTFKNIRNEAGQGNNIFTQTTSILADMSVALGTDMPGSAIKLGKALNDPIRGVTALTRVGVTFTDAQKDQIKALVDSGRTMDAQRIILKELRSEFGGSAKAAGDTFPGQLAKLRNSFDEVTAKLTAKLLPAATRLLDFFTDLLNAPSVDVAAKIAWTGVENIAGELWGKLVAAFKGDQTSLVAAADVRWTGIRDSVTSLFARIRDLVVGDVGRRPVKLKTGQILEWETTGNTGLVDKLGAALRGADWSKIGQRIGTAISASLTIGKNLGSQFMGSLNGILTGMLKWANDHAGEIAEIGIVIVANMFVKILDPAFWVEHWQLGLGVAVTALALVTGGLGEAIIKAFPLARFLIAPLMKLGELIKVPLRLFGEGVWAGIRSVFPRAAQGAEGIVARILGRLRGLPGAAGRFVEDMGVKIGQFLGFAARDAFGLARRLFSRITSPISRIDDWASTKFGQFSRSVVGKLGDLLAPVGRLAQRLWSRITSPFVDLAGWFGRVFTKVGDAISSKWSSIVGTVRGWVNKLIDAYNWIATKVGLDPIKHVGGAATDQAAGQAASSVAAPRGGRATGGWVHATPGGRVHRGHLVGEGGADEIVLTTDPRHRSRQMNLLGEYLKRIGMARADGGWLGDAAGVGGDLLRGAAGAASSAFGSARDAVAGVFGSIRNLLGHIPGLPHLTGPLAGLAAGAMQKLRDGVLGWVEKHATGWLDKLTPDFGGGGGAGGGAAAPGSVSGWVAAALRLLGLYSSGNARAAVDRAMAESGGNPRAINLWDSNARAGHPSKGLFQTIDSTFQSYMLPGHGDIWNPIDNSLAAFRYMMARYGEIVAYHWGPMAGSGYARGTVSAKPGWHWVGEEGPELVNFRGREAVLPAPVSRAVAAGGNAGRDRELIDAVKDLARKIERQRPIQVTGDNQSAEEIATITVRRLDWALRTA